MKKSKKNKKINTGFHINSGVSAFEIKRAVALGISILFFAAGMLIRTFPIFKNAMLIAAFAAAAAFPLIDLIGNIKNGKLFCEELVVIVCCIICLATGDFVSAAFVMLFYSVVILAASLAFSYIQDNSYSALDIMPLYGNVIDGENTVKTKPARIEIGSYVLVQKGETVPVDGIIERGISTFDLSPLCRSKLETTLSEGGRVLSGSVNLGDAVVVKTDVEFTDSTVRKIYNSFSTALNGSTSEEKIGRKIFAGVALGLILLAAAVCVVVPVFKGNWEGKAILSELFMLIACPFGIMKSLNLAAFVGIEKIFALGAVTDEAANLNELASISSIACNKTATVTESGYRVVEVQSQGISEKNFLSLVSRVESKSRHPIAVAIRNYCGGNESDGEGLVIEEIPGKGIHASFADNSLMVGNAAMLFDNGISCLVPDKQGTAVHLAVNGNYCGYILLENKIRPDVYDTIETLRALGVNTLTMLSNDLRSIVRPIAATLNFDVVKAELTLEEKISSVEYIRENRNSNTNLAFVGNEDDELTTGDAADLNIVTGLLKCRLDFNRFCLGFFDESFDKLPDAVRNSKRAVKISKINLIAGICARIIILILALFGTIKPVLAAIILAFISIASFVNSAFLFERY